VFERVKIIMCFLYALILLSVLGFVCSRIISLDGWKGISVPIGAAVGVAVYCWFPSAVGRFLSIICALAIGLFLWYVL
jgi:hypothetical protein